MITKISKIDEDIYQIDDNEIPLDVTSTRNLIESLGNQDINDVMDEIDKEGSIDLKTAEKGSVVEVYEVTYPDGEDIQEYVKKKDLVSQDLFPGVESEDINVKVMPKNDLQVNSKKSWREVLALQEDISLISLDIEDIKPEDEEEVLILAGKAFGSHFGSESTAYQYIQQDTDFSISKKLVAKFSDNIKKIVGFYLLQYNTLFHGIELNEMKPLIDLTPYKNKTGIEGVALWVDPKYRGQGAGNSLKDVPKSLGADYIWGLQFKSLNNLNDWLKRRQLVAENGGVYLTAEKI